MSLRRAALAALAAFVAYFVLGGLLFGLSPMTEEFRKYPQVYRAPESMKDVFAVGMAAMLLAMFVLAILYAKFSSAGSGIVQGTRFGALIGVFAVCSFVLHNYVNLNIGLKLTIEQAVAYFVQWTIAGIIIGAIYRPAPRAEAAG